MPLFGGLSSAKLSSGQPIMQCIVKKVSHTFILCQYAQVQLSNKTKYSFVTIYMRSHPRLTGLLLISANEEILNGKLHFLCSGNEKWNIQLNWISIYAQSHLHSKCTHRVIYTKKWIRYTVHSSNCATARRLK